MRLSLPSSRLLLPACAALLAAALLCPSGLAGPAPAQASYTKPTPHFVLEGVSKTRLSIEPLANYRSERMIEGMGWKVASTVRGNVDNEGGLAAIMRGGYTVLLPQEGDGIPKRHMYVLAGFDSLPRQELLVTIRDPEVYWDNYDYRDKKVDVLELVWYDPKWQECASVPLEYKDQDFPDGFRFSPDQSCIIAIRHPVDDDGKLLTKGHSLDVIYTADGEIRKLNLPEANASGALPSEWYPVYMQWDDEILQVVTKLGTRQYSVKW